MAIPVDTFEKQPFIISNCMLLTDQDQVVPTILLFSKSLSDLAHGMLIILVAFTSVELKLRA